jgi:Calx-beta domain-containing protein
VRGPEQAARISIGDASLAEGNAGQTAFPFTVSLDRAEPTPVTVDFSTADGTATAALDYARANGTVTFAPGETAKTVTLQVNGDTTVEPDETFTVNLTNAVGDATIADPRGAGTILNDDAPTPTPTPTPTSAQISIVDVRHAEGNSGRTRFRFRVSLDQTESAPVSVAFSTANRTAKAPKDYTAGRGTLTFAPGETAKTVTVLVKGERIKVANETFAVNLANPTGHATIARERAFGTIVNDDRRHARRKQEARGL